MVDGFVLLTNPDALKNGWFYNFHFVFVSSLSCEVINGYVCLYVCVVFILSKTNNTHARH